MSSTEPSLPPDISSTDPPLIPGPTTTGDPPQANGGSTTSSSLYLFTFLATLLLLLTVSCVIVARSLVVRRRFRRRVEEAIAAGIISPTQAPDVSGLGAFGRRRIDPAQKPHMWDAWITPGDLSWTDVKPVSARVISDGLTGAGLPSGAKSASQQSAYEDSEAERRPRRRLLSAIPFPLTYRQSPPARSANSFASNASFEKPGTGAESETSGPPPSYEDAKLQVSVLISMPSPYRPQAWMNMDSDGSLGVGAKGKERSSHYDLEIEEELPDVVFGVTEVPWRIKTGEVERQPLRSQPGTPKG